MTLTTTPLGGLPIGWQAAPEAAAPERVLVALSGGVDSSVAAALLVGGAMQSHPHANNLVASLDQECGSDR